MLETKVKNLKGCEIVKIAKSLGITVRAVYHWKKNGLPNVYHKLKKLEGMLK